MKRFVLSAITLLVLSGAPLLSSQSSNGGSSDRATPSMPSTEEINELLSKASEYVSEYQTTFKNAKPTLDKAPTLGFNERSDQLCSRADLIIASIKKNGPTAEALVGLISILDDLSLNGARASSVAMIVAMKDASSNSGRQALQDVQSLAQAEKNCYDISELILHPTLRLIAVEEKTLSIITDQHK